MKDAILVILINVISDIIPEISILEVKFIEVFRSQNNNVSDGKSKTSGEDRQSIIEYDSNDLKGSLVGSKSNIVPPVNLNNTVNTDTFISQIPADRPFSIDFVKKQPTREISIDEMNYRTSTYKHIETSYILDQSLLNAFQFKKDSFNNERQLIEKKLELQKKNFQVLEIFSKPWYSNQTDRKHRLGILHKATVKQQLTMCRVI